MGWGAPPESSGGAVAASFPSWREAREGRTWPEAWVALRDGDIMRLSRLTIPAVLAALAGSPIGRALADGFVDAPVPWEIGLRPPASPVAEYVHGFNNELLVIIVAISAFVLGLLLYVIWRFGEKRNPVPSKTSHNGLLEVLWTVIPVVILVAIAIPS